MAGSSNPRLVTAFGAAAAALLLAALPVSAQTRLSLKEAGERGAKPDYAPARLGEKLAVRGVVSAPAFHFPTYTLLAMQDEQGGGVLHVPQDDAQLDRFRPVDEVEAEGVVTVMAGMPMISPGRISLVGRERPPAPIAVSLRDLVTFPGNLRYLGRLIRVQGSVSDVGDTAAGGQVLVGGESDPYKLFVPSASGQPDMSRFERGDTVSASGVGLQFCPLPPYNHMFEMLVSRPSAIAIGEHPWILSPLLMVTGLGVVLFISYFLWSRERRLRKQRERLRRTYHLGEEILGSSSTTAILKRISEVLPSILGVTRAQLYIYNRAGNTLDTAPGDDGEPFSVSLESPPGGAPGGAVACFHYRTLLAIPDITRSPFPIAGSDRAGAPKSLLFVPMVAQSEIMGVLELVQDDRTRDFTTDEQALAQHLGNQIGVAIRLLDQRSVQEQLFRTEKLAAVGRLISGVVNELRAPLSSIAELSAKIRQLPAAGAAWHEVNAIASEAQKASAIVARLVAFASSEAVEARPVCISALLSNLIEFREADWKASGIRVNELPSGEPLFALGSQGQLEQVFLNLLVHAEQSLAEAPRKEISIRASVLAKRLVVEIAFTAPPQARKDEETEAVLNVARSIVAGHGGDIRLSLKDPQEPRFEVELPFAARERTAAVPGPARDSLRHATTLVIEPDETGQRHLLGLLAARGCRVVPIGDSDAGLELAQRMRFDLAFCSVHAPGLNWVELSERMQPRVGGFILLSDHHDPELIADFEGEGRFVLPKPVEEAELDRVLQAFDR